MGNCGASCRQRNKEVLRVVKMDGRIAEFRSPILVKDMLVNLSSGLGIGLSQAATEHLPATYELKLGQVYYVVPSSTSTLSTTQIRAASVVPAMAYKEQAAAGAKRIKVVITKQQLELLLTKKVSVEDFLSNVEKKNSSLYSPMPKLESIPEELMGVSS